MITLFLCFRQCQFTQQGRGSRFVKYFYLARQYFQNNQCFWIPPGYNFSKIILKVAAKWCSDPKIFPTASSSFVVQNNISRKVESVKVESTMAKVKMTMLDQGKRVEEKLNIISQALPEKRKSGRLLKNVGPKEKKRLIGWTVSLTCLHAIEIKVGKTEIWEQTIKIKSDHLWLSLEKSSKARKALVGDRWVIGYSLRWKHPLSTPTSPSGVSSLYISTPPTKATISQRNLNHISPSSSVS